MRRRSAVATVLAGATGGVLGGCAAWPRPQTWTAEQMPPPAPREWRAAWVASVAQIDWPTRAGAGPAAQQAEALTLIDRASRLGLNALILQVRPAGDALYPSRLEPWSEYLTGAQGRAPEPAWDPLDFWIRACAARGIELHAWLNPLRARHATARSPLVPPHLGRTAPHAVKPYGTQQWMDPAEPAARERFLAVVADIAQRYPLAGLHIDDYFYPYPQVVNGMDLPFPDSAAWQRHLTQATSSAASGDPLSRRADWRRAQVDSLVEQLFHTVRRVRPEMSLGISPFGIGRPDLRPPGVTGFSQYDRLYAHVERWLAMGWMDYCAPQLYWPHDTPGQPFGLLLDTWLAHNPRGLPIRPGLFSSGVADDDDRWTAEEIVHQIGLARARPGVDGHVHFSLSALAANRGGLGDALRSGPYAQAALVPRRAGTAASSEGPPAPRLVPSWWGHFELLSLQPQRSRWHAIWQLRDDRWLFSVQPASEPRLVVAGNTNALVISAVDAQGREGPRRAWRLA
jgi:uncharacterized lipoprotein YddW (UPF0748 family)